mmetsp:Transcript_53931/g.125422  ORF Transcript_53931/g.125422 Transcript_53931/m.125422 type:complete len:449 (+) Transcript_53931:101-1447(+)
MSGEEGDSPSCRDAATCARNVKLMLALQALQGMLFSVAMGPVFDKYLYFIGGGRNSIVGVTQSVNGLTSLVMAIPVGLIVDWFATRRAFLLRVCSVTGVIATGVGVVAVLSDQLWMLYVTLVLYGIFMELSSSASEAIFADSTPVGRRTEIFTRKAIVSTLSAAVGPFMTAVGFIAIGDDWKLASEHVVIITGFVLTLPVCAVLWFFADPPAAEAADAETTQGSGAGPSANKCLFLKRKHIPYVVASSDFICCIGAGMTIKFLSLFFVNDLKFTASQVNLLAAAYPVSIALSMKVLEKATKPLGRAQASCLFFSCNIAGFAGLAKLHSVPLLVVVHLLRGSFANSTAPIDRSIVMDFTPSSQRGRWNAVESLNSVTWSGSAFVGGLLSDSHDYRFTFLVTAGIYAVAMVVYAPLLWLVPRRERDAAGLLAADGTPGDASNISMADISG